MVLPQGAARIHWGLKTYTRATKQRPRSQRGHKWATWGEGISQNSVPPI